MPDFIFHANIAHYQKHLAVETDPKRLSTLRKLLAEELAKLDAWQRSQPPLKAAE